MADRFAQIDEVFRAARRVAPADREAVVRDRCAHDPSMADEVLSLLAEDQAATGAGPLDQPALGSPLLTLELAGGSAFHPPVPQTIGRYTITRRIGVGGMGVVYEAEQDNPRRTVALKVINPGMASPEVLRRFAHEAQALGRLQHPGIAQIFEAGTFDAGGGPQPYLAMELVRGKPLTEYAAATVLPRRQRMELMARVCDAVQHAHQRGVIHRDLKPANILVASATSSVFGAPANLGDSTTGRSAQVDANSTSPKILDFGVARITDAESHLTKRTTAGQLVGTLPYMSPEQAAGDPNELDTRSDVYALGVIAFELLTGQLPYAVGDRYVHEAVRVIREVEPALLSSIDRTLGGDVETVIGRALEKDKTRRYQSASEFGDDIRRCLRDEPILARPPSRWYATRKFAQRNRALMAGMGAVAIALVAGIIGVLMALSQAMQQRDRAVAQSARADAINEFLTRDLLAQAAPEANAVGSEISVRELLDRASVRLMADYNGPADVEASVLGVVGDTYQALGLYAQAEAHWQRAFDILLKLHGIEHRHTLLALAGIANAKVWQTKFSDAELLYQRLIETAPRVLGPQDSETLGFINNFAEMLGAQGKLDEAAALHRRNLESRQRAFGTDDSGTLESMNNLAALEYQMGHFDEAEQLFRRTVDARTRVLGREHPLTLLSMNNLGVALRAQNKLTEAEPIYRTVLEADRRVQGAEHPETLIDMHNLASLLAAQREHTEAEALYRQTIDLRRKVLGPRHAAVAYSLGGLGQTLCELDRAPEAEPYLLEALDIRRDALPSGHHATSSAAAALARCMTLQGKYEAAEQLLKMALTDAESGPSGDAALRPLVAEFVALYEAWARPDEAEVWRARSTSGH